jgi:lysozyme family protein
MTTDELIDGILEREGGGKFTNDPNDRGNATNGALRLGL